MYDLPFLFPIPPSFNCVLSEPDYLFTCLKMMSLDQQVSKKTRLALVLNKVLFCVLLQLQHSGGAQRVKQQLRFRDPWMPSYNGCVYMCIDTLIRPITSSTSTLPLRSQTALSEPAEARHSRLSL